MRTTDFLAHHTQKGLYKYSQDLKMTIWPDRFSKNVIPFKNKQPDLDYNIEIQDNSYDKAYNVARNHRFQKGSFEVDTTADYRYKELKKMIEICRLRHIEITCLYTNF